MSQYICSHCFRWLWFVEPIARPSPLLSLCPLQAVSSTSKSSSSFCRMAFHRKMVMSFMCARLFTLLELKAIYTFANCSWKDVLRRIGFLIIRLLLKSPMKMDVTTSPQRSEKRRIELETDFSLKGMLHTQSNTSNATPSSLPEPTVNTAQPRYLSSTPVSCADLLSAEMRDGKHVLASETQLGIC
jgi:hypothetical protein